MNSRWLSRLIVGSAVRKVVYVAVGLALAWIGLHQ